MSAATYDGNETLKTQIKDTTRAIKDKERAEKLQNSETAHLQQGEATEPSTPPTQNSFSAEYEEEELLVGSIINGNFRVEDELGQGAMGRVYLAEQLSLSKKIAIKVLHRHLMADKKLAQRFHREARAASSLNHPHSIAIIDFGQADNGALYIAMEYLDGRDLGEVLATEFPLEPGRIVKILGQVCQALDEAHHNRIVHRDLKPENIMVMERRGDKDYVKVCDFGIAKIQDPQKTGAESAITMAGIICGTPQYMSPEQAEGKKLDGRSDLYSLGVILYEMLTGQIPFTGDTPLSIVTKHLTDDPTPPRTLRPDLDIHPAMEEFVLKVLSKKPEKRPADALKFKEELEEVLEIIEGRRDYTPKAPQADAEEDYLGTLETTLPGVRKEKSGRAGLWIGLGIGAFLTLSLGLAFFFFQGKSGSGSEKRTAGRGGGAATGDTGDTTSSLDAGSEKVDARASQRALSGRDAQALSPEKNSDPRTTRKTRHRRHRGSRHRGTRSRVGQPRKPRLVDARPRPPTPPKETFSSLFDEGKKLFRSSRYREALAKFKKARRLNYGSAKVHKYIGKCYMRRNQIRYAVKSFKRYLKLAPGASDAWVYRGIVKKHSKTRPRPR